MVVPCMAAAQLAGAAGSAGATAMGLGMGKTDLDLTRDLFKLQMQQAKRLWTADWAEASVRHGEQCMQAAQQHSEAQALSTATYYQAEKLQSQGLKLARDQDSRAYEMTWRMEVRESLRDELGNQNNRFNIIMLCDTVCLGCVFSLVADGSVPENTSPFLLNVYIFFLGISITLFSVSLWCSVIVVRRLHEHTASILERKLFAESEDLQKLWRYQLESNLPTGPDIMNLVNQAYEKWVAGYIAPISKCSIHMLSIGVVTMFVTAGLLVHIRYLFEYNGNAPTAVPIFWSFVFITSSTVLVMKYSEDRKERKKEGVYDNSWQDRSTIETGPCAKICRAADELFSSDAVGLGSTERVQSMVRNEQKERELCVTTRSLHKRVEGLINDAKHRAKTRKDILQLLTTAAEELDSLPEELTSRLNKVLLDIDEADSRTANLVAIQPDNNLTTQGSSGDVKRLSRMPPKQKATMAPYPLDAQRISVSLSSLRRKLGEHSYTTLLRIRNLSEQPLRLKSGVQLKEGKFFKSLNAQNPQNNSVCYQLYPATEIPPRTEMLVAATTPGGWVPSTAGIDGEIVYTNRAEDWHFKIRFRNQKMRNVRKCQVSATHVGSEDKADSDQCWNIEKEELDLKANNEVLVSIDLLEGEKAMRASMDRQQSQVLKSGFLLKNRIFGLGLQWNQRWFVLNAREILYSDNPSSQKSNNIPIKIISSVHPTTDVVRNNVFEIHTSVEGKGPYRLAAASPLERDTWIQGITDLMRVLLDSSTDMSESGGSSFLASEDSQTSYDRDGGFECITSERGFEVLPV